MNFLVRSVNVSSFYRNLLKAVSWAVLGTAAAKGILVINWFLIARILGKEIYGEFGIIRENINTFAVFASFGLSLIGNSLIAKWHKSKKLRVERLIGMTFWVAVWCGILTGIVVFGLADWLALRVLKAPSLGVEIRLTSVIFLFYAINGAQLGILSGLNEFKYIAFGNIFTAVIAFPLLLAGSYYFRLRGIVCAFILEIVILTLINGYYIVKALHKNHLSVKWKNCFRGNTKVVLMLCLPAVLCGLCVSPIQLAASSIIFRQEHGAEALGIFSAIVIIQLMVMFVGNILNAPLLAFLAREEGNNNVVFEKINILVSWILGIFCILPFLLFPNIILLILGKNYDTRDFKISLLLVLYTSVIILYKQGLARVLMVKNLMWLGAISNLLWGGVLITAVYCFRSYGVVGLALGYLIAYIFITFAMLPYYASRKLIPLSTMLSKESFLIWGIFTGLVIFMLGDWHWTLRVISGIVVFVVLVLLSVRIVKSMN